ncbi:hypothetical protein ACU0QN_001854 [Citrobacter koseri]
MAADALSGLRIVVCLAGLCTGRCAGWRLTPYPAYVLWCVLLVRAPGIVPDGGYALSGLRIVVVFCWPVHRALCRMAATPYPAYVLCCVLLACASGVVPDGG